MLADSGYADHNTGKLGVRLGFAVLARQSERQKGKSCCIANSNSVSVGTC
jgi:hypothetical protein